VHFRLTASALTINLDPLRRLHVWGAPTLSSVESREKKLELDAAMKLTLLVALQGDLNKSQIQHNDQG